MTSSTTYSEASPDKPANSATRVATASFIGTAIEFYDFYVYATAAALVIGPVFFPQTSGTAQMLSAFLTFGIAFLAGEIILSGSLAPLLPAVPGDRFEMQIAGMGGASISFSE